MTSNQEMETLESRRNGVLTHDEQMELCRFLAGFHTVAEARAFVLEKFGKDLAYMSIKWYLENSKWKGVIDCLRSKYAAGYMEVPIANKRVRLERYEKIHQEAKKAGKQHTALEALKAAQNEVEGPKFNATQINYNSSPFQSMPDEELLAVKEYYEAKLGRKGKSGASKADETLTEP